MKDFFKRLHSVIDAGRKMLDDKTASIAPELFSELKQDGSLIEHGTRINWNGVLKRAAVDLWDTVENSPDNASALWEDVMYREGERIIPEVITAGLAFSKDECGWWNDILYKSTIDANTYTPEQYPAGWEEVIY